MSWMPLSTKPYSITWRKSTSSMVSEQVSFVRRHQIPAKKQACQDFGYAPQNAGGSGATIVTFKG